MLKPEDNQLLTRTNLGTPMGEYFRNHWIPALHVDELPSQDCPPVRVKLLGEYLVAYRNTDGEVNLVEEFCPHRNASLYYGRNEENGIRCVFHGWKFGKDGKCVDIPSEPSESKLKDKVCLKSYPCKEYGGIIWTYMGAEKEPPELPEYEFGRVPDNHRLVTKWHQKCNYVQGIEANMDSSHLSFLHSGGFDKIKDLSNTLKSYTAPKIEAHRMDYGLLIGAARQLDAENVYWRVTHYIAPCLTLIPRRDNQPAHAQAWVPIDDENSIGFAITWHDTRPLTNSEVIDLKMGNQIHARVNPGSFTPVYNMENDYMINRKLQESGVSYTGIPGVAAQDASVLESTRGIPDRTREYLGTSDIAIIQMRRFLMDGARNLENGGIIQRPDSKKISKLRSSAITLQKGVDFKQALNESLGINTLVEELK